MSLRLALRWRLFLAGAALALAGCVGNTLNDADACQPGQQRCMGSDLQVCGAGGSFATTQTCTPDTTCDSTLGCTACQPGSSICANNNTEVHSCTAAGAVGPLTMTCPFGQVCSSGACVDACAIAASEFVYLVDANNNFLSFEARIDTDPNALKVIGKLACGTSGATPFSMAIDRKARAWVLYTDGNIYLVNPQDASCIPSGFRPDQLNFHNFGMGFVGSTGGLGSETLYVGNNLPGQGAVGLATINPMTLALTKFANFPAKVTGSPELTGTGNSQLFGYFPSNITGQDMIVQINQATGAFVQTFSLTPLAAAPRDWAFAHWGGRYYQFITVQGGPNQVLRFDPVTHTNVVVQSSTPYPIVGAGVSTCAPITIG